MKCLENLGDTVHNALAKAGITPEAFARWMGRPCSCEERRQRLNQIGRWAVQSARQTVDDARKYLNRIMDE